MSKYIIDVGDAYIRHGLERTLTIPVRINEHEDHWMNTRIPVTPYTEPDMEKVREEAYQQGYEQGYKDGYNEPGKGKIQVGDEVTLKCGVRPAIYIQGTKGSDEIYLLFNDGSCGLHSKSEIERKTGRHFPEIVSVLEKMRGEKDG